MTDYSVIKDSIDGEITQTRKGDEVVFTRIGSDRGIISNHPSFSYYGYKDLDELLDDLGVMSRINAEEVIDLL